MVIAQDMFNRIAKSYVVDFCNLVTGPCKKYWLETCERDSDKWQHRTAKQSDPMIVVAFTMWSGLWLVWTDNMIRDLMWPDTIGGCHVLQDDDAWQSVINDNTPSACWQPACQPTTIAQSMQSIQWRDKPTAEMMTTGGHHLMPRLMVRKAVTVFRGWNLPCLYQILHQCQQREI